MRTIFLLVVVPLALAANHCTAQVNIEKETAFLYFIKVNGKTLDESSYPYGNDQTCFTYYCSEFDKSNYDKVKNDEFKLASYVRQMRTRLAEKMNSLKFTTQYSITTLTGFGAYDFENNSFPITSIFSDCHFRGDATMLDHHCLFTEVPITFGWIINSDNFDYLLKVLPDRAEKMINARKLPDGTVRRSIQTKIIFTFVNQPWYIQQTRFGGSIYNIVERDGFIIYIRRIEFWDNNQIVAILTPNQEFEDPVSGFKKVNGEDSYHMVIKDNRGEVLLDNTIELTRSNGLPSGPVKYYNQAGQLIRMVNCSHFFPNNYTVSGDDVSFMFLDGFSIPYSIQQYQNNRLKGYQISLYKGGDRIWGQPVEGVYISKVSLIDDAGFERSIVKPRDISGFGGRLEDMSPEVQALVKRYDFDSFFQYRKPTNTSPGTSESNETGVSGNESLEKDTKYNELLTSTLTGNISPNFIAGITEVYTNKKTDTREKTNVLFLLGYKDGSNENLKPETKDYIVREFQNTLMNSIVLSPAGLENFNKDSLFKVELSFTARLTSFKSLDAYITTKILITQNGKILMEDSFERSRSLFLESNDPYVVLRNVIGNCQKRISKLLQEYISIK